MRYSLSQTLMSNALQYKASKGFRYTYYICRWWLEKGRGGGGVHHNFWEIWRGVRANLPLLRGGYCVTFLLAKPKFVPHPPPAVLIIIAQPLSTGPTRSKIVPHYLHGKQPLETGTRCLVSNKRPRLISTSQNRLFNNSVIPAVIITKS